MTRLDGLYGSEQPRWSPDGRFLLIDTQPQPQLVSLEAHTIGQLAFDGRCDWWTIDGSVCLLGVIRKHPEQRLASYRLDTAELIERELIALPEQPDLPATRQYLLTPRVAPDGRSLLVGITQGPGARYQNEHGSRARLAVASLDGQPAPRIIAPPFVDDDGWVEREHASWCWVPPAATHPAPVEHIGALLERRVQVPPAATLPASVELADAITEQQRPWAGPDPFADYDASRRDETVVLCDLDALTPAPLPR